MAFSLYVKMSKCVNPFTPLSVISATMKILNGYPEDSASSRAKTNLCRLSQRLGYSAPEKVAEKFWHSSLNYEGYYDICRAFDENDARSKELFVLYGCVISEFNKNGFESRTDHSER